MKKGLGYLGYGLLWYTSWVAICFILLIVKIFLIGDFLVLAILGLFSIVLTLVGCLVYELALYLRSKFKRK